MSYQVPTLADLLDRTRKSFRKHLPGSDAWVWPNNIGPTAKVVAGGLFEIFGFAGYIAKMTHVHSAPDLETLKRHGNDYGIAQRPAYPATGTIKITSEGALTVAAAAVFQRTDGVQYVATAAASTPTAGDLEVPAMAFADGATANAEEGTPLSIVSGVTDALGTAVAEVSDAFTGGADVEDIESYRARILFRKRNPPHGGSAADYVMWASSVTGVSRVFVERLWAGPGSVRVFPLMDGLYPNGIPNSAAVARIADYLEAVRPAGALVSVAAPVAVPVNVEISGLVPSTAAVREAVTQSLRDAFTRLGRVAGSDTENPSMPYLASPASFSRSWVWQAVANATGEQRHTVVSPSADVVLSAGQIATLGTVTFT